MIMILLPSYKIYFLLVIRDPKNYWLTLQSINVESSIKIETYEEKIKEVMIMAYRMNGLLYKIK